MLEYIGSAYRQYKYHFEHGIFEIPKCKYSGEDCYFINYLHEYAPVNEYYYRKYLMGDKRIKCKWLRNERLLDLGFTEAEIAEYKDTLHKMRLVFSSVGDINALTQFLLDNDFTEEMASKMYLQAASDTKEILMSFVEEMSMIKSFKNHELEYWVYRGHPLDEAKRRLYDFFRRGPDAIREKRKDSVLYDKWFRDTRRHGASKSWVTNSNNKTKGSLFENAIISALEERGYSITRNYFSPVVSLELRQLYNKHNFIHDGYFKVGKTPFILEYNGSYWHKDFTKFPKFTQEDYLFEIKKAHNCTQLAGRENKPNYILIWEGDFDTPDDATAFIEGVVRDGGNGNFYPSRKMDHDYYVNYQREYDKHEKDKRKFGKVVDTLSSDSHCEKMKVGAIAVKDRRIIATGINGTPRDYINCDDYFRAMHVSEGIEVPYEEWKQTPEWGDLHRSWSEWNELHAEQSLICEAARTGMALKGCDIYVTHKPCTQCSKLLSATGVKRIYFVRNYHRTHPGMEFLLNSREIIFANITFKTNT